MVVNVPMHATLADVAREAGVGTTTVSRFINGGHRVSRPTAARVQAAIDRLNFVPNHAARILKGERTKLIAVVVPSVADPFFSGCIESAQRVARSHGCTTIVLTTHNDPELELESIRVLTLHRTEGLLLVPAVSKSPSLLGFFRASRIPVVCFDRPVLGASVGTVVADNARGARMATDHLVQHGYRRILCLGGEMQLWTIQQRLRGYRDAMSRAGLEAIENLQVHDYATAEQIIVKLKRAGQLPDAIFCLKNIVTVFVYEVLRKLKLDLPESVALLGFDDFELAEALGVSVVQQPEQQLGEIAAEKLFAQINGEIAVQSSKRNTTKLMPRLVVRTSCGCSDVQS